MTRSPPITAHLVRVLAVAAVVVGGVDRHHDLGLPVDLNRYLDTTPGYSHSIHHLHDVYLPVCGPLVPVPGAQHPDGRPGPAQVAAVGLGGQRGPHLATLCTLSAVVLQKVPSGGS